MLVDDQVIWANWNGITYNAVLLNELLGSYSFRLHNSDVRYVAVRDLENRWWITPSARSKEAPRGPFTYEEVCVRVRLLS